MYNHSVMFNTVFLAGEHNCGGSVLHCWLVPVRALRSDSVRWDVGWVGRRAWE